MLASVHLCIGGDNISKKIEFDRGQGKLFSAIEGCRRFLDKEPADEAVCRTAMELLWQTGQKQQALSLYQTLQAFMAKEYNAEPSAETIALYEKIKQGNH